MCSMFLTIRPGARVFGEVSQRDGRAIEVLRDVGEKLHHSLMGHIVCIFGGGFLAYEGRWDSWTVRVASVLGAGGVW